MKIYYAHCVSVFNTPQEVRDAQLLKNLGFEVYNPNNEADSRAYEHRGMDHFKELVFQFPALAFRALPDGRIPAGVFKEVMWAREAGALVIELPSGVLSREMDVPTTREYLAEVGQR